MKKGKGNTTAGLLFSSYNYLGNFINLFQVKDLSYLIGTPFDNQKDQTRNDKLIHKAKIHQPFSGASKPN